jgi:AraC-like DNA-binding protein
LVEQSGARFGGELSYQFATGYDDPVVRQLGGAVLLALENGDASDGFFLDHILNAIAAHVLRHYGDVAYSTRHAVHGGLTPRQLRCAKELMRADLGRDILLSELADLCGLSATHFARAFRQSTGTSPHRWLLDLRIEHAKGLLLEDGTLSDVALNCGFADQSHFTRTFTKHVGISPGRWRRSQS